MIIVLKPFYEVMNHCDLPCQLSAHSALCIFTYCLCHYPYHDPMVQVTSGRWCTHVLANLLLVRLSCRMPVLGQQPLDFMG
jgi:hypothetical protein